MGLSDQERIEKMLWSCRKITTLGADLRVEITNDYDDKFKRLADKIEEIWPAMLNGESNGIHWLLGSSATNKIESTTSIWGCAIAYHCEKERRKHDLFSSDDLLDFDPMHELLSITSLLRSDDLDGKMLAIVYEIFAWTEEMTYALRRYDDELNSRFEKMSSLISTIQGMCFDIFSSYNAFAKAYLANEIFKKMYFNKDFKKIALKQYWHHYLTRIMHRHELEFEQIMDWHRVIHKEELPLEKLIVIALKIMGRRYHYDHNFKALQAYLSKFKTARKAMLEINAQFIKNKKDNEDKSKDDSKEYQEEHNQNHMSIIHGYQYDRPEKEIIDSRNEQKKELEGS